MLPPSTRCSGCCSTRLDAPRARGHRRADLRTAATATRTGIFTTSQLFRAGFHIEVYQACLADLHARRRHDFPGRLPSDLHTIELRDVRFRYPGQEKDALQGVHLTLRAGR